MDEKLAVSINALNAKLKEQVEKRKDAPAPSDVALEKHFAVVTSPVAPTQTGLSATATFFDTWDTYYPRIVSLLGWASWVIPGPTLTTIKALLAVVNNQIIPIIRGLAK